MQNTRGVRCSLLSLLKNINDEKVELA